MPVSSHPRPDNQSCATPSTPGNDAWASHDGCVASARDSRETSTMPAPPKRCAYCHAVLTQLVRGRRKRFCDVYCKNQYAYHGPQRSNPWPLDDQPILHCGPFQRFAAAYRDAFDVIIVDPPYSRASLPLYRDLGAFAMVTLKVGGWILCMTGDAIAAEVEEHSQTQ